MPKIIFLHLCSLLVFLGSPVWCREVYDLEAIINRALEANWVMVDARDDIDRARLRLEIAEAEFELKIYPGASVGFSGGDEQSADTDLGLGVRLEKKTQFGTQIDVTPSIETIDGQYRSRTGVHITQPLLRGAGRDYTLSGVYSARFDERTAFRMRCQREIDTVVGAVRHGYEVVRQRELLRLRQESYQRLGELAEATSVKQPMGLASSMDLYRVRIQRNQAEEERNRSREAYADALDTLKIFLALPLEKGIDVFLPLDFDRIDMDEEEMIQTALARRLELEQLRDALTEAERLSERAETDMLPELDIRLFLTQTADPSSRFPGSAPENTRWGISLGSSTDLRRSSQEAIFEVSLLNVRQADRRQRIAREDITAQVKREIRNLERLDKGIINQEEQIHQARGQLELARAKFEHGMADNFDLIDAEIALRRAQTQLISAVIDYIVGQYRLRAVIGTLVDR